MKYLAVLVVAMAFISGCVSTSPVISKSKMGNLQINVYSPDMKPDHNASVYLDGVFVGNLTRDMPVLYPKRGERVVRIECPGYSVYERTITVLGDPNHQVLNVVLSKE